LSLARPIQLRDDLADVPRRWCGVLVRKSTASTPIEDAVSVTLPIRSARPGDCHIFARGNRLLFERHMASRRGVRGDSSATWTRTSTGNLPRDTAATAPGAGERCNFKR